MQTTSRMVFLSNKNAKCIFKHVYPARYRSITGHEQTDNALKTVTRGRVDVWMQAYEDFVGLTEVKLAQNNVLQVRNSFLDVSLITFMYILIH